MTTTLDPAELKNVFKEALSEVLLERRAIFHDLIEEIVEDIALARAIEDGLGSGRVSRDEIFRVLDSKS